MKNRQYLPLKTKITAEIKKDPNKWREVPYSWTERLYQ